MASLKERCPLIGGVVIDVDHCIVHLLSDRNNTLKFRADLVGYFSYAIWKTPYGKRRPKALCG